MFKVAKFSLYRIFHCRHLNESFMKIYHFLGSTYYYPPFTIHIQSKYKYEITKNIVNFDFSFS